MFEKVWEYDNDGTSEFFAELDRRGDPGRFDRAKAHITTYGFNMCNCTRG